MKDLRVFGFAPSSNLCLQRLVYQLLGRLHFQSLRPNLAEPESETAPQNAEILHFFIVKPMARLVKRVVRTQFGREPKGLRP